MKKPLKNILKFVMAGIMILGIFCFAGCAYEPKYVEGDVWNYYILKSGKIALMGLNPAAVPEDGVLYIPNKIDGREIAAFSISKGKSLIGGYADFCQIPSMGKIIIADGVPIGGMFMDSIGRILEFESKTAQNIYFGSLRTNIIVPDGCREVYIAAMEAQKEGHSRRFCILEKSEVVDWYVDGDGLLKGYFGLDYAGDLVLPAGIKKIDDFSLGGGATIFPKTLSLNDDLEEIGKRALDFSPNLNEITIPKSVKHIDEDGVIAHKVYLYRSTACHEKAFWHLCEIIYLD